MTHLKKSIFRTEHSATLFGMKKKGIGSQIILSKLLYIGQIYTIPKLIKEEFEKKNYLKSPLGLGILDIDTQLNSLKFQWI